MKALKKQIKRINNKILGVYARLLDHAQGTEWWKSYSLKKRDAHWQSMEDQAISKFSEKDAKIWGPVVKNQVQHLRTNEAALGYDPKKLTTSQNNVTFKSAVRVMQQTNILRDIVAVQPLQAPTGLVYHMAYSDTEDALPDGNQGIKGMKLSIAKDAAEAKTRKLQASYNLETLQDYKALGLDIEADLGVILGIVIGEEVIGEVLNDLITLAKNNTITEGFPDMNTTPRLMSDISMLMHINVNRAASGIAFKTRRGRGNFIVVSPMALTYLQSSGKDLFQQLPADEQKGDSMLKRVGTLNKSYRVYVSLHEGLNESILVGYKGDSGECDTGYIHSPYIPVMMGGPVMDPVTFQPFVPVMTRYAKKTFAPHRSNEKSAPSDYYALVDLSQITEFLSKTSDVDNSDEIL